MNPYYFSIVALVGLIVITALYVKLYVSPNNPYNIFKSL
jgi:hypothetical protein